jgi:hypothetical protein
VSATTHTENSSVALCDCCDKRPGTARIFAFGIETWACDECRGVEPSPIGPAHVFADADNNGLNARVLIEALADEKDLTP